MPASVHDPAPPDIAGTVRRVLRMLPLPAGVGLIAFSLSADGLLGGAPGIGPLQGMMLACGAAFVAMPFLRSPLLARLSLATGAILLFLVTGAVAGELALRLAAEPLFANAFESDSVLLYRRVPGSTSGYQRSERNGGGLMLSHVNHSGFRGEEQAASSRARPVIVYGDSFIEGYFSAPERTLAGQLQSCLSKGLGSEIPVLNAGVRGYGPDQILLRIRQELGTLAPSVAVVAIYAGNDFGDLIRNELFEVSRDSLRALHPAPGQEMISDLLFSRNAPYLFKAMSRIRQVAADRAARGNGTSADSATIRQTEVYRTSLRESFNSYRLAVQNRSAVTQSLFGDPQDVDIELDSTSAESKTKLVLMRTVLSALVEQGRRLNIPILFVIIPSPVDVVPNYDVYHVDRESYPTYNPLVLTNFLDTTLTQLGAWHLNLEPVFTRYGASDLYMHFDDPHWSDAGQPVAAEAVCREIGHKGLN